MSTDTVTINGITYDRHTGLPVARPVVAAVAQPAHHVHAQHAGAVHHRTQKSTTLNRRYVHPTAQATPKSAPAASTASHQIRVTKRPAAPTGKHTITHFAKSMDIAPKAKSIERPATDIASVVHPMVQRVAAATPAKPAATIPKPSHIIKQEAIEKSLREATPAKRGRTKAAKHTAKAHRGRTLRFATAGMALFLIAGYFTYLNMPNLSVRVAAAQAGIDATYPSYRPSGYSLSGPVAYNEGQVSMKFAMNGSNQNFTLTQVKSSWDSSAIQSNYVIPAAGSDYDVAQVNGLTIYTYDNNAAWVNGNILYTIKGDATLTPDQIQRIATSL